MSSLFEICCRVTFDHSPRCVQRVVVRQWPLPYSEQSMAKRKAGIADDLLLNKVVLRPEREYSRFPEMLGRPFESFAIPSAINGVSVAGWYFAAAGQAPPLALLNPSNRGTKAAALDHALLLLECGCSVLMYDYQGFGDSAGLADVRTLTSDAEAALSWAVDRAIWASDRPVVLMGLSLGSLVAIHLAASRRYAVKATILDGAIEPYRALRRSFGPLGAVVAEVACSQIPDDLDSQRQIQSVTCPVLFVHGRNDTVGTLEEAQYLVGRTGSATLWALEDCDHLDVVTRHPREYRDQLRRFLDMAGVL